MEEQRPVGKPKGPSGLVEVVIAVAVLAALAFWHVTSSKPSTARAVRGQAVVAKLAPNSKNTSVQSPVPSARKASGEKTKGRDHRYTGPFAR